MLSTQALLLTKTVSRLLSRLKSGFGDLGIRRAVIGAVIGSVIGAGTGARIGAGTGARTGAGIGAGIGADRLQGQRIPFCLSPKRTVFREEEMDSGEKAAHDIPAASRYIFISVVLIADGQSCDVMQDMQDDESCQVPVVVNAIRSSEFPSMLKLSFLKVN